MLKSDAESVVDVCTMKKQQVPARCGAQELANRMKEVVLLSGLLKIYAARMFAVFQPIDERKLIN